MARIDGLGGEIEEKIGKLSAELNDLDVKITTNVTALGQSLIIAGRGRKSFIDICDFRKTAESGQG